MRQQIPPPTFSTESAPVIPFVDPSQLDDVRRALCDRAVAAMGFLPNSLRTYLHHPTIAAAVLALSEAIQNSPVATLERGLKAKLGVICSATNGCVYCTSHQCNIAQQLQQRDPALRNLSADELLALISGADEGATAMERACFAFARTASGDPGAVPVAMLEQLQKDLTPAQVVELAAVVGFWKFFNTVHDSLHIPSETGLAHYSGFLAACGGAEG